MSTRKGRKIYDRILLKRVEEVNNQTKELNRNIEDGMNRMRALRVEIEELNEEIFYKNLTNYAQ